MRDRDAQTIAVQLVHLAAEIRAVICPTLQYVELPLVDHLVSQCRKEWIVGLQGRSL